jgi:2-oxoglutarate dehydrogenase E1 component
VADVATCVPESLVADLLCRLATVPETFTLHSRVARQFAARRAMAAGKRPIDWGAAEALAFATLLRDGYSIRLSGQDSQRGTFGHRHAVIHDRRDGTPHIPLSHLAPGQGRFDVYNSPLSESGVLGFDFGYSLDCPDGLVIWEARFGDFCNVAQVIVDQFIAAAEDKWDRLSGLCLLLPHGFEGQGPEHSSARIERFLSLAANDNMQIVYPSTAAQYFHCLRRQVLRPWRKPLIVMSPKGLLQLPVSASPIASLTEGAFARIIDDDAATERATIRRVVLCTGKLYHQLARKRAQLGLGDTAILRLEQLYPFPAQALSALLASYPGDAEIVWAQEESENMGAWPFLRYRLAHALGEHRGRAPRCVSRPESTSPAVGSKAVHDAEQAQLVDATLMPNEPSTSQS